MFRRRATPYLCFISVVRLNEELHLEIRVINPNVLIKINVNCLNFDAKIQIKTTTSNLISVNSI